MWVWERESKYRREVRRTENLGEHGGNCCWERQQQQQPRKEWVWVSQRRLIILVVYFFIYIYIWCAYILDIDSVLLHNAVIKRGATLWLPARAVGTGEPGTGREWWRLKYANKWKKFLRWPDPDPDPDLWKLHVISGLWTLAVWSHLMSNVN